MPFRMYRVFCATPREMESERDAFLQVIQEANEDRAMPQGVLFVPVTLTATIQDKRLIERSIDENIRDCRYYVLVLEDSWGPPERNFERDYRLAIACRNQPGLPMQEVALLFKGQAAPPDVGGDGTPQRAFTTPEDYRELWRQMLGRWLETILAESAPE